MTVQQPHINYPINTKGMTYVNVTNNASPTANKVKVAGVLLSLLINLLTALTTEKTTSR